MVTHNKLINLCIGGWIEDCIKYLTSDEADEQTIENAFAYIMINDMENCFFKIVDLIAKKIDIYSEHKQFKYFEYACIGGNIRILSWFLLNGYNMSNLIGCLSATTHGGHIEASKFLISNGANTYEHINCDECFAFLNVVLADNEELIKLFIENGADIVLTISTIDKEYKEKYKKEIIDKINNYWNKYKIA